MATTEDRRETDSGIEIGPAAPRLGHPVVRRLAAALAQSRLGRFWIGYVVLERPDLLFRALGGMLGRESGFSRLGSWPPRLSGFEDVAPMVLSSNEANRGIAAMSLIEISHLWRLASEAGPTTLIEIGRERGGSTLVIAAALAPGATLHSYDPQSKHASLGQQFDEELLAVLHRYGLAGRVEIVQQDSQTGPIPDGEYALVLVDGDPTYSGTRRDFERFCRRLEPGGHALFHDAAPGGRRYGELARLMEEIERTGEFDRRPDVGTFVHFVRRDT